MGAIAHTHSLTLVWCTVLKLKLLSNKIVKFELKANSQSTQGKSGRSQEVNCSRSGYVHNPVSDHGEGSCELWSQKAEEEGLKRERRLLYKSVEWFEVI